MSKAHGPLADRPNNPKVGLELGYMWTTSEAPDRDRTHAHVAFVWLNLAL